MLLLILFLVLVSVNAKHDSDGGFTETKPQQIHIALAGKNVDGISDGMSISWMTNGQIDQSKVGYGLSSRTDDQVYDFETTGKSVTYLAPSTHHHVTLSNLKPDTTYYYSVFDQGTNSYGEEYSFVSAGDWRENWSFIVFGDWGLHGGDPTLDTLASQFEDKNN